MTQALTAEGVRGMARRATATLSHVTSELWARLFDDHRDAVYRVLRAECWHAQDVAEDLVLETFKRAAEVRHKLKALGKDIHARGESSSGNGMSQADWRQWLLAIARNVAKENRTAWALEMSKQDSGDAVLRLANVPDFALRPDELAVLNDRQRYTLRVLQEVMSQLTPSECEILALHYGGELSYEDIAHLLTQHDGQVHTADAVRQMASRAFRKIKVADLGQERAYDF